MCSVIKQATGAYDLSQGREKYPILLTSSSSDQESSIAASFQYVKTNVPGPGCDRNQFYEQYAGCSCLVRCLPLSCSCMQNLGCAYEEDRRIKTSVLESTSPTPVLECGSDCKCDNSCRNRVVQNAINRPFSVFLTSDKGCGLKLSDKDSCQDSIHCLDFVCEYGGEVVGEEEACKRVRENERNNESNYLIVLREHVLNKVQCTYIDPKYLGNLGRFINHSCDPNLIMIPVRVNHPVPRLALFARRVIQPGEELTFDYSGSTKCFPPSSDMLDVVNEIQISKCEEISSHKEFINKTGLGVESEQCHKLSSSDWKSITVDKECISGGCSRNRKQCFCGSHNCTGFLPLDENLLKS